MLLHKKVFILNKENMTINSEYVIDCHIFMYRANLSLHISRIQHVFLNNFKNSI